MELDDSLNNIVKGNFFIWMQRRSGCILIGYLCGEAQAFSIVRSNSAKYSAPSPGLFDSKYAIVSRYSASAEG